MHVFTTFHIICFAALVSISAGELWSTISGSSRLRTAWRGQRRFDLKNFFYDGMRQLSTGSCGLCCRSKRPAAYKILLGIHTERATETSKQVRNLEKLVLGPNGADIALLKLQTWASFFLNPGFQQIIWLLRKSLKSLLLTSKILRALFTSATFFIKPCNIGSPGPGATVCKSILAHLKCEMSWRWFVCVF